MFINIVLDQNIDAGNGDGSFQAVEVEYERQGPWGMQTRKYLISGHFMDKFC